MARAPARNSTASAYLLMTSDTFTPSRRASKPGTNHAASNALTRSLDHGRITEAISTGPHVCCGSRPVRCRMVSVVRLHVKALDIRYKLLILGIRHCSLCNTFLYECTVSFFPSIFPSLHHSSHVAAIFYRRRCVAQQGRQPLDRCRRGCVRLDQVPR